MAVRTYKIRSILLVSFLLLSLFTPIFAYISYTSVQDATTTTMDVVEHSSEISNLGNDVINASSQLQTDIEQLRLAMQDGSEAEIAAHTSNMIETFSRLQAASNQFQNAVEDEDTEVKQQLDQINQSVVQLDTHVARLVEQSDQSAPDLQETMTQTQNEVQTVNTIASSLTADMVEDRTDTLAQAAFDLRSLSQHLLYAGAGIILLGLFGALVLSFMIARPINKLHREAEKIKDEDLEAIELDQVQTRIYEFQSLRDIVEDIVLTLKTEFEHERTSLSEFALDMIDYLDESVPRAVAESSFISACRTVGVNPATAGLDDAEVIIDQLEVATQGLDIDETVFASMRKHADNGDS